MPTRSPRHRSPARTAAMLGAALALTLLAGPAWAGSSLVASGGFEGRSSHTARGGASIVETSSGYVLLLEPGFVFDGAPDPKLGFGKDGFQKQTLFSELRANQGAQAYALPKEFDPADHNEVWIWCEKFSVPLGVAALE